MFRPSPVLSVLAAVLMASSAASAASPFGRWRFDPALSASAPGSDNAPAPPADAPPPHRGGHHGKGGMGDGPPGGMAGGAGGMGGHQGGGRGGHGQHGDDDRAQHARPSDLADDEERGLARTRATTLAISEIARRIRFDDGEHAIELGRDGMNVSGAGIGGTAALSASDPDLVVDSLTDRGTTVSERYHVSDDGRRLEQHVTLRHDDDEAARTFVRVFDRVEAAAD